jgi:hypothetical protein
MLLFRSEGNIDHWCKTTQMPRGELLSIEQVWRLSQAWYADRLSDSYQGRTAAQAEAIFRALGLEGPFWTFD